MKLISFIRRFRTEGEYVTELMKEIERTELDLIKSRTDEQSNLIMFYKNRSEDSMRKSIEFEKKYVELNEQKTQVERDFEAMNSKLNQKR